MEWHVKEDIPTDVKPMYVLPLILRKFIKVSL